MSFSPSFVLLLPAVALGAMVFALFLSLPSVSTYKKVGGLHFMRIGRVQLAFCLCRTAAQKESAKRRATRQTAIAQR